MNNRGVSAMQVGNSIDDRGHSSDNLGRWETLLCPLQSQHLKIHLLNRTHKQISSTEVVIIEDVLDTRQYSTIKRCERYIIQSKAIPFPFSRVDQLCQGKELLFITLIPYKINATKITVAKQTFYHIMLV